jgi:hypothetical protein
MSDFAHSVASEETKDLQDTGMRASRLVAPSPITIPTGTFHAVSANSGDVACGRSLHGLFHFERHNWAITDLDAKCPACLEALAPPPPDD